LGFTVFALLFIKVDRWSQMFCTTFFKSGIYMTQLFKTFIFEVVCVIIFGCLYWIYRDDFSLTFASKKKNDLSILECFYTSVTVQSGVGYSILNPNNKRAVLLLMIQQLIMIFANILMVYLFSMYFISRKRK
jgi:hypothetical protein